MAKTKKKSPRARSAGRKTKRKATKVVVFAPNPKHRKRSRPRKASNPRRAKRRNNPSRVSGNLMGMLGKIFRFGGVAFLSGLVVREATQRVLGPRNQGLVGYAGNGVATVALALLARWARLKSSDVAAVLGGGGYAMVERFKAERFNPIVENLSLSGLGDAGTLQAGVRIRSALRGVSAAPAAPAAPAMMTAGSCSMSPAPSKFRTMSGAR